uniref:Uncharacterized protein n=1 Tax=Rhizophora mucronata TaxID=61149 RepID=A0A2P2P6S2_RHIMU
MILNTQKNHSNHLETKYCYSGKLMLGV